MKTVAFKTYLTLALTLVVCLLWSVSGHSKVSGYSKAIKYSPLILPAKIEDPIISEQFMDKVLPKESPTNSSESDKVLAKMGDRSLSYFWETSNIKNTSVGRTAEAAEKKINVQATYQGENNVQHKFSFRVLAIQAMAKFEYKGWVNAALNYDIGNAKAEAEIVESISKGQKIVLSHSVKNVDQRSALSLRWDW